MGGGSSKQADVKMKEAAQKKINDKMQGYKPGQKSQDGAPTSSQVQEMDKRKLEAQQQMEAAQQQREALVRQ